MSGCGISDLKPSDDHQLASRVIDEYIRCAFPTSFFPQQQLKRIAKLALCEGKRHQGCDLKQIFIYKARPVEQNVACALWYSCAVGLCGAALGKKEGFVSFALQKKFACPGNRGAERFEHWMIY